MLFHSGDIYGDPSFSLNNQSFDFKPEIQIEIKIEFEYEYDFETKFETEFET